MRILLMLLMLVFAPLGLRAQETAPEVDRAEVMRRGDLVQVVGDGARASGVDAFAAAMGPPASDADKWFISVVSMKQCAGCEKLKKDWSANHWLLALANPADPKQSWAHYNVFDKDDDSQAFRFEALKITAYPTILVQPPRSKRFGDPSVVVYHWPARFSAASYHDCAGFHLGVVQAIHESVGEPNRVFAVSSWVFSLWPNILKTWSDCFLPLLSNRSRVR